MTRLSFQLKYLKLLIFLRLKVIITTYKVATILEIDINSHVRNKRKEKALEAYSNLINSHSEKVVKDSSSSDNTKIEEKSESKHESKHQSKHEKKKKRKKHK